MIPKVIHYCWFSGEEMPQIIKNCIDSWHRYMPDYEYRLWDMESIRGIDIPFVREALECRKWAFAADYVRVWAVEKYGGIYIDSDVEMLGSLDRFLSDRMFIGRESKPIVTLGRPWMIFSSHIFGAESHHPFLRDCLNYYECRRFKLSDNDRLPEGLRYDMRIAPEIQAVLASSLYGYDPSARNDRVQHCADGLNVYESDLFSSGLVDGRSVCRHLFCGSWRGKEELEINEIKSVPFWRKLIGRRTQYIIERLLRMLGYVAFKI